MWFGMRGSQTKKNYSVVFVMPSATYNKNMSEIESDFYRQAQKRYLSQNLSEFAS